jgi:hypothetical protein
MAGTTRLELATSAVTVEESSTGLCRISRLDVRLSATTGFIGLHWNILCNEFVQRDFLGESLFFLTLPMALVMNKARVFLGVAIHRFYSVKFRASLR